MRSLACSTGDVRSCSDLSENMDARDGILGCLTGLAVCDALGTTLEFKQPGTFYPIDDMVGGGPFGLEPGQWTDDTSMALCLADSLIECGAFDPGDQMRRYVRWWRKGYRSSVVGQVTASILAAPVAMRSRALKEPASLSPDRPTSTAPAMARSCASPSWRCSTPVCPRKPSPKPPIVPEPRTARRRPSRHRRPSRARTSDSRCLAEYPQENFAERSLICDENTRCIAHHADIWIPACEASPDLCRKEEPLLTTTPERELVRTGPHGTQIYCGLKRRDVIANLGLTCR